MFAHPLTLTRRPPLTQTSALATPEESIVTIADGMAARAKTVAAATAHDLVQRVIRAASLVGAGCRCAGYPPMGGGASQRFLRSVTGWRIPLISVSTCGW